MVPTDLKYTQDHEWIRVEGEHATVGVTDYAQEQLTDIVFVELPEAGRMVKVGDAVAVLESVKSVADVYCPLAGEVTEVNEALVDHPEQVNEDPFGEGWIFRIKAASSKQLDNLMDAPAYEKYVQEEKERA